MPPPSAHDEPIQLGDLYEWAHPYKGDVAQFWLLGAGHDAVGNWIVLRDEVPEDNGVLFDGDGSDVVMVVGFGHDEDPSRSIRRFVVFLVGEKPALLNTNTFLLWFKKVS